MYVTRFILIIALGVCSITSMPAHASEESVSLTVKTEDLNLTSPADARRLHTRLAVAASAVCQEPGTRGLDAALSYRTCRKSALSNAKLAAERAIAAATLRDSSLERTTRR